jgi:hypothetical protein
MADAYLIAKNSEFSGDIIPIIPIMANGKYLIRVATGTGKAASLKSRTERLLKLGMSFFKTHVKSPLYINSSIDGGNNKVDELTLILARILGKCEYAKRH